MVKKWLLKMQPGAEAHIWQFQLLLATVTVITVFTIVESTFARWALIISLFLYYAANLIVVYGRVLDVSNIRQANHQAPEEMVERDKQGKRKLLLWVLLAIVAICSVLYYIAQRVPSDTQGHIAFFAAVGATGAWMTGIALALFTYQQWQLRKAEHSLLYTPRLMLDYAGPPIVGRIEENGVRYPYGIKWDIFVRNLSRIPILIHRVTLEIRLSGNERTNRVGLDPLYAHLLEPPTPPRPFQVSLDTPKIVRWIVEGTSVGETLDYVSAESNRREFELVCRVSASMPQNPEIWIAKEFFSEPIHIPQDAPWGDPISFLT